MLLIGENSDYCNGILRMYSNVESDGDLANFLKHVKKKGEMLDEKIILTWFLMLVMGIQALHSKNVLHRDLKSANIFLTSKKSIKIGDFGISKVLDSTSAKTFVGTPYYLSPEVCSNKKYDLRSDLWSLGCILYQLCTLNYPFQANNILSLALKITSEQITPIPKKYSKQLNSIVQGLLTKDQNHRLSLQSIFKMPFMQKFMKENANKIQQICNSIPLVKINRLQTSASNESTAKQNTVINMDSTDEKTMNTIKSKFQQTNQSNSTTLTYSTSVTLNSDTCMSPKDLMKMRKQQKIKKNQQRVNQATIEQIHEMGNFAKSKKQEEFSRSGTKFGPNQSIKSLQKKYQIQNKEKAEAKYRQKIGLNDKQSIDLEQLNQACQLTKKMNGLTISQDHSHVEISQIVKQKIEKENESFKAYTKQVDKVEEELEEYYDDDFEEYNEDEEVKTTMQNNSIAQQSMKKGATIKKDEVSEKQPIVSMGNKQKKEECIRQCISITNTEKYKTLYALVSKCSNGHQYIESSQLKQLRKYGSLPEKQALKLIDQIKYYQSLQ